MTTHEHSIEVLWECADYPEWREAYVAAVAAVARVVAPAAAPLRIRCGTVNLDPLILKRLRRQSVEALVFECSDAETASAVSAALCGAKMTGRLHVGPAEGYVPHYAAPSAVLAHGYFVKLGADRTSEWRDLGTPVVAVNAEQSAALVVNWNNAAAISRLLPERERFLTLSFTSQLWSPLRAGGTAWFVVTLGALLLFALGSAIAVLADGGTTVEEPIPQGVTCLQRERFADCRDSTTAKYLDDALAPLVRVKLDAPALSQLGAVPAPYRADAAREWAILKRPATNQFFLCQLLETTESSVLVLSRIGAVAIPMIKGDELVPLGIDAAQPLFDESWSLGDALTVTTLVATLFCFLLGHAPLHLPATTDLTSTDLQVQRFLRVLPPLFSHRTRDRILLAIRIYAVAGGACLSAWIAACVATGENVFSKSVAVFALGLWLLLLAKDALELAGGVDFNVVKELRATPNASPTTAILQSGVDLGTWLTVGDLRLLRRIESHGVVAALLGLGMRSPHPTFRTWNVVHADIAHHNQLLLASFRNLQTYSFIRWVGDDIQLTEHGLRALALPEFYVHPRHPAELMLWLAEIEHAVGRPGESIDAVVRLMRNIERGLKRAVAQIVDHAENKVPLIEAIYRPRDKHAPLGSLNNHIAPLSDWLTLAGNRLGLSVNQRESRLKALTALGLWRLRLQPAHEVQNNDLDRPRHSPDPATAAVTLGDVQALVSCREDIPWPSEYCTLPPGKVESLLRETGKDTLAPLFDLVMRFVPAADKSLRPMADRIVALRNGTFHDKREQQASATAEELMLSYEAVWLARPLLFALAQAMIKANISSDVWADSDPLRRTATTAK